MPAIEAPAMVTAAYSTCPLCDAPLNSANPNECPRCDWVLGYRRQHSAPIGTDRDAYAAILSVVPGLGHIYKGHLIPGLLFMAGGIFAIFIVGVIATFTMGFGLLLLPLYWVAIMVQVYWIEDRRAPKG